MALAGNGPVAVADVNHLWGHRTEKTRSGLKAMRGLWEVGRANLHGYEETFYAAAHLKIIPAWLTHDAMCYRLVRKLPATRYLIGYDCDPAVRMDAQLWFGDAEASLEMDTGSESPSVVMGKLGAGYRGRKEPILFVTLWQSRIDKLRLRMEKHEARDRVLFALWRDLLRDPKARAWQSVGSAEKKNYTPLEGGAGAGAGGHGGEASAKVAAG